MKELKLLPITADISEEKLHAWNTEQLFYIIQKDNDFLVCRDRIELILSEAYLSELEISIRGKFRTLREAENFMNKQNLKIKKGSGYLN